MPHAEPRTFAIERRSSVTAALLLLTAIYAVLQVGFVRPYLPVDPRPNFARPPALAAGDTPALEAWRDARHAGPGSTPTWRTDSRGWARAHLGMVVQVIVFTVAALVLFALRSSDLTAQLSVLALALSGVAGGGPLHGAEHVFPLGLWKLLTVFTWLAGPLAFPIIALAILYFPSPSPLLTRRRWLNAVPFVAAAPMLVLATATSLYLVGVDAMRDLALWDAAHPGVYSGSFALALTINVAAVVEGVYRYKFNHDANERRRIRMAVYTAVPGVFAYALKDGVPIVAMLMGTGIPSYPWPITAFLQLLVLLPAFGLTYAVGVARVLGPALVLRRSLQYALANRALAVITILPGAALVYALLQKNLLQIITSGSVVYLLLFVATLGVVRYRDRARQWLDQRFFREEYDARKILAAVCAAIDAAHQEGVLHRDLKPENILLPGGEVEAKVLDFGVAKLVSEVAHPDSERAQETHAALTMAGTIVGTPAYMAPEQLCAAALDARTDVFALGVIAYEMLCGDLPFSRGSLTDVILSQARGAQPLTERDPDIPAALDRAVRRALEMAPEERPATPHAFASDVVQALGAAT